MRLASKVDPMAVRPTAADPVRNQPAASGGTFHSHGIAELHRFVNETITYVPDPRSTNYVASSDETLDTEAGDCDCQAVLVASLFEAIGATTRLARCESVDGDWHMLAEGSLADSANGETETIACSLGDYYDGTGANYGTFYFDIGDGRVRDPADTAMGRCVGDLQDASGTCHPSR